MGDSDAMRQYLNAYRIRKHIALKRIYGGATPEQKRKTQISIRCGTSPKNSDFIFIEGAGNTSQIVGFCPLNRLDHLRHDFKYLISQMRQSDIKFKLKEISIQINDERLVKKSCWNYVLKRTVLVDLITMTGFIPLISAYVLNVLSFDLIYPVTIGFIFWFVTIIIGYRSEPEYVLK